MTMSASARSLKRALLISSALAALGAMTGTAKAQAFNATPTTAFGTVTYNRATPGVETVRLDTNTAVIDWRPNSTTFLPGGNFATFTNGVNVTDFVVLNRILSTQPMRFDGTVLSQLVNGAGQTTTGGTVIFSSPGGLIVGATGFFDVGSLVLTTLNVNVDAGGNFYDAATRGISLSTGPSPIGSPAVVTEAGARLRALQPNSYIALIGPVVQHAGSTRVNGSAAYVAGEQVTFRANQGLFDIIVDVGSGVAVPLDHSGSTGGPANTTAADNHAIYLVAAPKNQAITALLQGDIGFDPAVSVGVENGVIVLSAGANLVAGEVDRYGQLTFVPGSDFQANLQISGGTVSSDLIAVARTNVLARPIATPTLTFQQDASLFGGVSAELSVGPGDTLDVLGNALVSASAFNSFTGFGDLTGGTAQILTDGGGTIHIFGTATVDASATGLTTLAGDGGAGTGGTAEVVANGGAITIDNQLTILATGTGGTGLFAPVQNGGAGTGGTATLSAQGGGTVNTSDVTMIVDGAASGSSASPTQDGAAGTGGTINVTGETAGSLVIGGTFFGTATGLGGFVPAGGVLGGTGQGGTINVGATDGDIDFNSDATFVAAGSGGAGPTGGAARGGDLNIDATRGSIDFLGLTNGGVDGVGGDGIRFADGGDGVGGTIRVATHSSGAPARIGGGILNLFANGFGGNGGSGAGIGSFGGDGGNGTGGSISVFADSANTRILVGATRLQADGTGGIGGGVDADTGGGTGGDGFGGSAVAGTSAAGAPGSDGTATFASADISAVGTGGEGGVATGTGGNGTGGTAGLSATGATATVTGATNLVAEGRGGLGGPGLNNNFGPTGQGAGGAVNLNAAANPNNNGPGTLALAAVTGSANATGAPTGNVAGAWHIGSSGGSNVNATGVTFTASAQGTGAGVPPASTLDPLGGAITVSGTAQLSTDGDIQLNASGTGRAAGGTYNLIAGRDVVMSNSAPVAGAFNIDVANLSVQAARDVTLNTGILTRSSNVTNILAPRLATFAGRATGRVVNVTSADLIVTATGGIGDTASDSVDIEITNNAAIGGQILGLDILVNAATINIGATGQAGSPTSNQTELNATGAMTVAGTVLGRDVQMRSASLGVGASGAIGDATSQTVNMQVTNGATVAGRILGQDILLNAATIQITGTGQAGGAGSTRTELRSAGATTVDGTVLGNNVVVNAASLGVGATGAVGGATTQNTAVQVTGNANVSGQLLGRNILVNAAAINVAASGTVGGGAATDLADLNAPAIAIAGRARARSIRLASADIDIGATGSVGDAATQLVTLAISATGQFAVLGGTTQGPGYTLTNAEAGRIRADTLRVNAPALGANPALFVRDLTLTGGGAASGLGLLDVATTGVIRVEGAVLMSGARATDGFSIFGQQRLEVVTPTASVRVRDGAGAPGGVMNLSSNNIWIASAAIIDALRLDPNYAGRDDDLIDNDGIDAPRGYVEANGVTLNANGSLYVQNTTAARGSFVSGSDFGGITTGATGLTIIANAPNTNVYAFGRRLNPDGSYTFGDAFFFQSTYNTSPGANYTPTAALNTCIIPTGQCPVRVPPDIGVDGKQPITGPTDGSVAILLPQTDQDDVIDSSFAADPLIEQPVTSGSEPGQWNCDPDHDGDCDDQPQ